MCSRDHNRWRIGKGPSILRMRTWLTDSRLLDGGADPHRSMHSVGPGLDRNHSCGVHAGKCRIAATKPNRITVGRQLQAVFVEKTDGQLPCGLPGRRQAQHGRKHFDSRRWNVGQDHCRTHGADVVARNEPPIDIGQTGHAPVEFNGNADLAGPDRNPKGVVGDGNGTGSASRDGSRGHSRILRFCAGRSWR